MAPTAGLLVGLIAVALGGLSPLPTLAQVKLDWQRPDRQRPAAVASKAADCSDGLIYDDGTPENAIGWVDRETSRFVMRFERVGRGTRIDRICVCLTRASSSGSPSLAYELVVHADDGGEDGSPGRPGTELGVVPVVATDLPVGFTQGFYGYDVAGEGMVATTDAVWIGVDLPRDASSETLRALCIDQDGLDGDGGLRQPSFTSDDDGATWTDLATLPSFGDPRALGVRAESSDFEELYLPYFEVDTTAPDGRSTLFLIRNVTSEPLVVRYTYLAATGELLLEENAALGPEATRSLSLRDLAGLPTSPDGVRRGWMRALVAGFPSASLGPRPWLTGDFFQLDPGNDFATGNRMPGDGDLCLRVESRFLDFGSGTELRLLIREPRGAEPETDPPSFSVRALAEDGEELALVEIHTDRHSLRLDAASITEEPFGSLVFDFTASGGGFVYASHSALRRFSTGIASTCLR